MTLLYKSVFSLHESFRRQRQQGKLSLWCGMTNPVFAFKILAKKHGGLWKGRLFSHMASEMVVECSGVESHYDRTGSPVIIPLAREKVLSFSRRKGNINGRKKVHCC